VLKKKDKRGGGVPSSPSSSPFLFTTVAVLRVERGSEGRRHGLPHYPVPRNEGGGKKKVWGGEKQVLRRPGSASNFRRIGLATKGRVRKKKRTGKAPFAYLMIAISRCSSRRRAVGREEKGRNVWGEGERRRTTS